LLIWFKGKLSKNYPYYFRDQLAILQTIKLTIKDYQPLTFLRIGFFQEDVFKFEYL